MCSTHQTEVPPGKSKGQRPRGSPNYQRPCSSPSPKCCCFLPQSHLGTNDLKWPFLSGLTDAGMCPLLRNPREAQVPGRNTDWQESPHWGKVTLVMYSLVLQWLRPYKGWKSLWTAASSHTREKMEAQSIEGTCQAEKGKNPDVPTLSPCCFPQM